MSEPPEVTFPASATKTTVPQKLTFGGMAVTAVAGLLWLVGAVAQQTGNPSAVTSAHATQVATADVITRSEVELVATKAARAAAVEVSGEAARWRDAQKLLFDVEVGRINDRMTSTNDKLDRVIDLLEYSPRRRKR